MAGLTSRKKSSIILGILMLIAASMECDHSILLRDVYIQANLTNNLGGTQRFYPTQRNLRNLNIEQVSRRMQEEWEYYGITQECYYRADGFLFVSGYENCTLTYSENQSARIQCTHDLTDYYYVFLILGYKSRSNPVEVLYSNYGYTCFTLHHSLSWSDFGTSPRSFYHDRVRCVNEEPCIDNGFRLMYFKYRNDTQQPFGLERCNF